MVLHLHFHLSVDRSSDSLACLLTRQITGNVLAVFVNETNVHRSAS